MHDVFINGGGPAGVVLAIRLRAFGLRVLLAGTPRRFAALEGMAERGRSALAAGGCAKALAALGPRVSHTAFWSGTEFGGNREHLVTRVRVCASTTSRWCTPARPRVGSSTARGYSASRSSATPR